MKRNILIAILAVCCAGQLFADLPKEKVQEIADTYVLILCDRYKLSKQQREDFKSLWIDYSGNFTTAFNKASIKKIEGNNVIIKYQSNNTGYLQLTEDGKIKYDFAYRRHPIDRAFEACAWLEEIISGDYKEDHPESYYTLRKPIFHKQLIESGIPLFGYSLDQSDNDNLKSLRKIKIWLLKDGETWDSSEPKLPLPEIIYKQLHRKYK